MLRWILTPEGLLPSTDSSSDLVVSAASVRIFFRGTNPGIGIRKGFLPVDSGTKALISL